VFRGNRFARGRWPSAPAAVATAVVVGVNPALRPLVRFINRQPILQVHSHRVRVVRGGSDEAHVGPCGTSNTPLSLRQLERASILRKWPRRSRRAVLGAVGQQCNPGTDRWPAQSKTDGFGHELERRAGPRMAVVETWQSRHKLNVIVRRHAFVQPRKIPVKAQPTGQDFKNMGAWLMQPQSCWCNLRLARSPAMSADRQLPRPKGRSL